VRKKHQQESPAGEAQNSVSPLNNAQPLPSKQLTCKYCQKGSTLVFYFFVYKTMRFDPHSSYADPDLDFNATTDPGTAFTKNPNYR
jgi:hypothetical protein